MENQSVGDIFASQGIVALLAAIIICVLHLAVPDYCAEMVTHWLNAAVRGKPLDAWCAEIYAAVAAWFA